VAELSILDLLSADCVVGEAEVAGGVGEWEVLLHQSFFGTDARDLFFQMAALLIEH
jgi:hypothetical protein